ncbi:MAG: hypothetical protein HUK40_16945 [Desulfobacter sp.]|nr:hypothetical protein [Desulfobacter sp.]
MEKDINKFIDEIYAPAYIKKFADDYRLDDKVKGIVENAPENLLPVLTRFVEKSYEVIEKKRGELLNPVRSQRNQLIEDIDASHRQLQATQAIISGHLASVRNVHDAQNDVLKTVGLERMREKLSENTEKVSNRISCLIEEAEKAEGKMDKVEEVLLKIKETINQIKPEEN